METLSFSMMQLIEESSSQGERFIFPTKETFNSFQENFSTTVENTYYEITVEKHNEYFWVCFDFNKPDPRDENLTHIETGSKRINDRTAEEVELIHQSFFLYHYSTNILHASNLQKKKLFSQVLKEVTNQDFIVKSVYKTFEEFIGVLKKCNKISFTHANNLFSTDSVRKQALVDLTGTDAPDNFSIEAKYSKHVIENFIRDLMDEKRNHSIEGLVVCGTDESGFELIYNTESLSKKINVYCEKDENGKYKAESVKENLIKMILR